MAEDSPPTPPAGAPAQGGTPVRPRILNSRGARGPRREASWAALALRVVVGVGAAFWAGGYLIYFVSEAAAKKIWGPMVWLVQNPPDTTLATLLGIMILTALFFEPMHEFLTELDEVLGAKRRPAQETAKRKPGDEEGPTSPEDE